MTLAIEGTGRSAVGDTSTLDEWRRYNGEADRHPPRRSPRMSADRHPPRPPLPPRPASLGYTPPSGKRSGRSHPPQPVLPCNCGVSKGLRSDHESQCQGAYVGRAHGGPPPLGPVLLLDDPHDESQDTPEQRAKVWEWFNSVDVARLDPEERVATVAMRPMPASAPYDPSAEAEGILCRSCISRGVTEEDYDRCAGCGADIDS